MAEFNTAIVNDAAEVPVALIQEVVAQQHGLRRSELLAHRRDAQCVRARHIVVWLAKRLTTLSYTKIAALCGRDHTTILHSVGVVEGWMRDDAKFAQEIEALIGRLIALAGSGYGPIPKSIDPMAAAERVALGGARPAMGLSTLEVIAICVRLLDLDELAAGTFQLLANIDRLQAARGTADEAALIERNRALITTVATALSALGYQPEPDHGEDQDENPSRESVCAAE